LQIKYIGISSNVKQRLKAHIKSGFPHMASQKWIASLREDGLRPVQQIVFTGMTHDQAKRVESRLILAHTRCYGALEQKKFTAIRRHSLSI
jgi:predicted GIY-YIG superfamily endonuclease